MSENTKADDVTVTQADAGPHATADQARAAQKRRDALEQDRGVTEAPAQTPKGRRSKPSEES